MYAPPFFSARSERDVLEFVIQEFPFPLAVTYARLHEEMDRQEPTAAARQLRDARECLLKFVGGFVGQDRFLMRRIPSHERTDSGKPS
jgi:hypothetical protein